MAGERDPITPMTFSETIVRVPSGFHAFTSVKLDGKTKASRSSLLPNSEASTPATAATRNVTPLPPSFDVESKSRRACRSNYGGQAGWVLVSRGSTTNHSSRMDFEAVVDDGPTLTRFGCWPTANHQSLLTLNLPWLFQVSAELKPHRG